MTWKEFKEEMEKQGATDETEVSQSGMLGFISLLVSAGRLPVVVAQKKAEPK